MPKAIWNDTVLAESNNCQIVEGNYYFPPDSINQEYFKESSTHTSCPWKGQANYYTIEVDGQQNKDAAWSILKQKRRRKILRAMLPFGEE